ncbi:uncharacterized protein LOC133290572 [Gastrolobium bilobum]|uniref:uncharacterized protein LOC133290572 n=1 Tax=Gastrolobium bilobum TaxID=150636 RepID=UPI002AB2C966|nr:uncharacterized protein LOC133290572 [Gastrolobium bilobum]
MAENTRLKDVSNRVDSLQHDLNHRIDSLHQRFDAAELLRERQFLNLQELQTNLHESNALLHQDLSRLITLQQQHSPSNNNIAGPSILGAGPNHNTSHAGSDPTRARTVKLDFPKFSSGDPTSWITAAVRYFRFYSIPPQERVLLAAINLFDPAACWFNGSFQDTCLPDWDAFCVALQFRFGPSEFEDPAGALVKIQQSGSVTEYQATFEKLVSKVPAVSTPMLRSIFISGLKPRIKRLVLTHRPQDFHEAYALARVYEDHVNDEKPTRPWYPPNRVSIPNTAPLQPITPTSQPHSNPAKLLPAIPIRRLSQAERQERRDKNLCYNCDEKFVMGHKCKGRATLLYLEGLDDDPDPPTAMPIEEPPSEAEVLPEISFNALFGTHSSRLHGSVAGHGVQILIDGGSTHNFITPRMSQFLHLLLLSTTPFKVQVGNGDTLICSVVCQNISLVIQSHPFNVDLFVLELKGADIVLGVQWLSTLGPILTDYKALTMSFDFQGSKVSLQGEHLLQAQPLSTAQLHKLLSQDSVDSYLMCLTTQASDITDSDPTSQSPEVLQLLDSFQDVFTQPTSLPPTRHIDHRILLQPDSKSVQVRPYRYPHFQKNEIEKLVNEMLHLGQIRHSQSPFSSLVLLVKKKDGTWRFCVDYRALNAITIRDKFPIPTIDELLDELHGATIFSKLDLRSGYHQIRMAPEDIHKTAFRTHHGHYEFLVMPFGLSNAPSTFQATMNEVFSTFLRRFVVIFFDDILIYSSTFHDHLDHLHAVLSTLRRHSLYAKLSKCHFEQQTIHFFGPLDFCE